MPDGICVWDRERRERAARVRMYLGSGWRVGRALIALPSGIVLVSGGTPSPKAICPVCGEFQPHACAGPRPGDKPGDKPKEKGK